MRTSPGKTVPFSKPLASWQCEQMQHVQPARLAPGCQARGAGAPVLSPPTASAKVHRPAGSRLPDSARAPLSHFAHRTSLPTGSSPQPSPSNTANKVSQGVAANSCGSQPKQGVSLARQRAMGNQLSSARNTSLTDRVAQPAQVLTPPPHPPLKDSLGHAAPNKMKSLEEALQVAISALEAPNSPFLPSQVVAGNPTTTPAQAFALRSPKLLSRPDQFLGDADAAPISNLVALAAGVLPQASLPFSGERAMPTTTAPPGSSPVPETDAQAEPKILHPIHASASNATVGVEPVSDTPQPDVICQVWEPLLVNIASVPLSVCSVDDDLREQPTGAKSMAIVQKPDTAGSGAVASLSEVSTNVGCPTSLALAPTSATTSSCGGPPSCVDSAEGVEHVRSVPKLPSLSSLHVHLSTTVPEVQPKADTQWDVAVATIEAQQDKFEIGEILHGASDAMDQTAQDLQKQLSEALDTLNKEKTERLKLESMVRTLSRRLDEGLASVSQVVVARSETEGATDAVLGAMRRCIDELSAHCAWPLPGDDTEGGEAPTLSEAVRQQRVHLHQLLQLQTKLQGQHEEHRHQSATLDSRMQQQDQRLDEGIAAIIAATTAFPARLDTLASSINALQHRVAELAVASAEQSETNGNTSAQLCALQERFESQKEMAQAEKVQLAQAIQTFQDQKSQLEARQLEQEQQIAAIAAATSEADETPSADSMAATEASIQDLKEEIDTIATALSILCNRVNIFTSEDKHRAFQTELGSIARMVSLLSLRVDQLAGQDALLSDEPLSRQGTGDDQTMETSQDLRQRLAVLVDDVRRVHEEQGQQLLPSARVPRQDLPRQRVVPTLPMSSMMDIAPQAPNPSQWMAEPLSVSVGRNGTLQSHASIANAVAERILSRGRC